jgi:hypothetical protein
LGVGFEDLKIGAAEWYALNDLIGACGSLAFESTDFCLNLVYIEQGLKATKLAGKRRRDLFFLAKIPSPINCQLKSANGFCLPRLRLDR